MKMRIAASLLSGLTALILPACDEYNFSRLKPGESSMETVRQVMGAPAREWRDADGSQTWEYPRTPEGVVNYMLDIAPDGKLKAIRQVLTEENFARVRPGMTREQIRRLLGQPAREQYFPLKNEYVWYWKTPGNSGADTYFNVSFDESGKVVRAFNSAESRN